MNAGEHSKLTIRIPRGKLAILYDATNPFSDEICYITINDKDIIFSGMIPVLSFEYKIYETKNKQLSDFFGEKTEIDEYFFKCNMDELNTCLAPFSKKTSSKPIKKSEETVFFEVYNGNCKFKEKKREFSGEPLEIEEFSQSHWHPIPKFKKFNNISGNDFNTTINRISATGESKMKIFNEEKKVFLKSDAGKEKLGNLEEKENFSFYLPRTRLKKSCSLISELNKFKMGIVNSKLLLVGEDKKSTLRILLNDVKEVEKNEN